MKYTEPEKVNLTGIEKVTTLDIINNMKASANNPKEIEKFIKVL